ncbi:hypothetical protein RND81_09G111600 [Saponaria officinalis]|uniref:Uncharacterized protein n=1 Tax=Saponaria officinalis TaxID=3572 RepID=A0AAW1IJB3_SAPOF
MEQNTPMIAKKIWNLIRVAFFMLRKGICKRKLLLDHNLVMKRGKIAGKTIQKLMFQHQHQHQGYTDGPVDLQYFSTTPPGEYEFSCSNTPLYRHYFTNKKKQRHNNLNYYTPYTSFEDMNNIEAINDMFNMINLPRGDSRVSPALSELGLGLNAGIRQLRITDSPFPVQNAADGDGSHVVDVAAEDFINKFYSQLKKQKYC